MLSPFTRHPRLGTLSTQLYLVQCELKIAVVSIYSLLLTFPSYLENTVKERNLFVFIDGHNSDEIS